MPYQKPKDNHPWRNYSNRKTVIVVQEGTPGIIPVRDFIDDLSHNWEKIEITLAADFEGRRTFTLRELPQAKIAAWLAGMLKKHYVGSEF